MKNKHRHHPTNIGEAVNLIISRMGNELGPDEKITACEKLQAYLNRLISEEQNHRHEESHDE